MWTYEKRLQYPVNIKNPDPKLAQFIMSQYGGPDGEIGASLRYLSQRYAMPYDVCKATLTDIGTEELAHMEIVAAIIHQLTRNLTPEQIVASGFGPYYIDHTTGIWPQSSGGVPFSACAFQSKGDAITDLTEDLAADGALLHQQKKILPHHKCFHLQCGSICSFSIQLDIVRNGLSLYACSDLFDGVVDCLIVSLRISRA